MKQMIQKLLPFLLLLAAASAQTAPATTPAPAATPATTAASNDWLPKLTGDEDATVKKARTLLTQMIEALGGDNYMNVTTIEQTGITYSFYNGKPNSLGIEFHRLFKFPDKERLELTKQRDVIYIENADVGYEITYKGTAIQEPSSWREYVGRRNYSLENLLHVWLKEPGTQIYYEGSAIAEQRMTEVVTVMNVHNETASIYIDQNSHLPVKKSFTYRSVLDKQKDTEGEIYGNWRMEGPLNTPHSIVRTHNGDYTNQRFIRNVTYNAPMADSLFEAKPTYDPYVLERKLDTREHPKK
ncbi:hypothetical protein Acid345_0123 [Candidatus Koribacter versatilis Ellin345]|uniref:Outer membrane lipoprotein-sorting protein n=1 Tax=Koribacter versatilis (strain Ellin345) TaxID=204669 RepID=Q1IVH2_KORVE|nr:hypothetical protein [Candidatus Koribacter versatilis]ABF39128.1 hypothetical protein Acid345_0123 [Candidatus Koribacter versatilis Ellin345]